VQFGGSAAAVTPARKRARSARLSPEPVQIPRHSWPHLIETLQHLVDVDPWRQPDRDQPPGPDRVSRAPIPGKVGMTVAVQ
jgi:hypothetical protein